MTLKDADVQRSLNADERQALTLANDIIRFQGLDGEAAMRLAQLVDHIILEDLMMIGGNDQKARGLAAQVKQFQGRDGANALKLAELIASVLSD